MGNVMFCFSPLPTQSNLQGAFQMSVKQDAQPPSGERTSLLPSDNGSTSPSYVNKLSRPRLRPLFAGGETADSQHWSTANLSSAQHVTRGTHLHPAREVRIESAASMEFQRASPFDVNGKATTATGRPGDPEQCCPSRFALLDSLRLVLFPLSMPLRALGGLCGCGGHTTKVKGATGIARWYLSISQRGWSALVAASMFFYALMGVIIMCGYMGAAWYCGAKDTTLTQALYFFVVTFVANGGYLGEDPKFVDPTTQCYHLRTYLVFCASYFSIGAAGIIAAMFVTKASQGGGMKHRVHYSSVVLLAMTDEGSAKGDGSPFAKLSFRMVDSDARNVFGGVASGTLKVHLMTQSLDIANPREVDSNHSSPSLLNPPVPSAVGSLLQSQDVPVQCCAHELPWFCSQEAHGDRPLTRDASAATIPTNQDLRLWFPTTIDIFIGPSCATGAQRDLWRLLSHVSAGDGQPALNGPDASPASPPWYNFQIVCEYTGVDATLGKSFTKRRVFYPSDILISESPEPLCFAPMVVATVTSLPPSLASGGDVEMNDMEVGCGSNNGLFVNTETYEGRRLRRFQRRRAALGNGMLPLPHNVHVDEDALCSVK